MLTQTRIMMRIRGCSRRALPWLITLLLSAWPIPTAGQTQVKPGFNLFSPQQDIEIGRQSAVEAEKQLPLLNERRVTDYLNRLGQRLAAQAPGERYPYTFKVVNASDINAFALPGGPIYVNRGTIEAAQSEGELAGVVAHELSHVALRHGTHQASKAYLAQAGLGILGGVLGQGSAGKIIGAIGGLGLNTLFLKYGRDAETQADVVGARIMARADYDPLKLARFFEMLQREAGRDPSKLEKFLNDHPSPGDRTQRIEKEAAMLRYQGLAREVGGFDEARTLLTRMPKAPRMAEIVRQQPPSTGGTTPSGKGGASTEVRVQPPSSNLRTYRSPSGIYQLGYPENWRPYPGNDDFAVTFLPEGGAVETADQSQIVYGAIINQYRPINVSGGGAGSGGSSLSEATKDLADSIVRANPYLRVVSGSSREARLAGRNGMAVTLIGRSPIYGRDERVTLYTRALSSGEVLYLLFISPNDDYRDYSRTFERMLKSLTINDAARRH